MSRQYESSYLGMQEFVAAGFDHHLTSSCRLTEYRRLPQALSIVYFVFGAIEDLFAVETNGSARDSQSVFPRGYRPRRFRPRRFLFFQHGRYRPRRFRSDRGRSQTVRGPLKCLCWKRFEDQERIKSRDASKIFLLKERIQGGVSCATLREHGCTSIGDPVTSTLENPQLNRKTEENFSFPLRQLSEFLGPSRNSTTNYRNSLVFRGPGIRLQQISTTNISSPRLVRGNPAQSSSKNLRFIDL